MCLINEIKMWQIYFEKDAECGWIAQFTKFCARYSIVIPHSFIFR